MNTHPGAGGGTLDGEEILECRVPVATVWTSPDGPRARDRAAVRDDPDVAGWTASMDAQARKGLAGRTLTQLLLGEPVRVLEEAGDWLRVAAVWQPSSTHGIGYPGWVRRAHLAPSAGTSSGTSGPSTGIRAVVTTPTSTLRLDDGTRREVSFGTSLPVVADPSPSGVRVAVAGATRTGVLVAEHVRLLSDGGSGEAPASREVPGFVSTDGSARSGAAPLRAPADSVLAAAGRFLGLRYLWGGTSGWGLDCSGLVHLTLRAHGIRVPRDAFDQAAALQPVALDAVEPGDLYFFARPEERIYHVGFVSRPVTADGVRRMLHAPEGGELVEDAPLAPHRVQTLVAAARLPAR